MQKDAPEKQYTEKKPGKPSRKWLIIGGIYLAIMLFIVCVVNSRHIGDFFSGLLSAFRPVILGLAIAYITNPLYNFLHDNIFPWQKKAQGLRKVVSMVATYAVIVLFLIVFVMLLLPQLSASIQDLASNLEMYVTQTLDYVNELVAGMNLPFDIPVLDIEYLLSKLPGEETLTGEERLSVLINNLVTMLSTYVPNVLSDTIGVVLDLVVAFFIAGYTLASKQRLGAQIRRILTAIFRENGCREIISFAKETDKNFGRYVVGKLLDSALVIILASVAFSLAGIPYAILVGFIVGATNIIPFFGPIFGAVPCGLLVFITEPRKLITFIIVVLIIQQIDANILDPFITGNATGLSSLGVIASVSVMGNLFGIMGLILGVPITVALLNLGKRILDRKLIADNMPTELEPYYPAKTDEVDKGSGEHIPLFTKLLHYYQARRALAEARNEVKRSKKHTSTRPEDDIGTGEENEDENDHK